MIQIVDKNGFDAFPQVSPYILLDRMIVLTDIIYRLDEYRVTVPKGYFFDGASIPRVFWSTTGSPYTPDFMRAALIHDYIYDSNPYGIGKKKADKFFYEILRMDGVGKYTAWKMYKAVDMFGWGPWKKLRKKNGSGK